MRWRDISKKSRDQVCWLQIVSLLDLVQEVDLVLGGVHIDVDVPRIQFEGEVDERMGALIGKVN